MTPPSDGRDILAIIPARMGSTRFPGKPLVPLTVGGTARPMIEWTWRAAVAAMGDAERVIVATDDARIADVVAGFGGRVAMTPEGCANGTERCAAALDGLAERPALVVNVQGDSPLTVPGHVRALIQAWRTEGAAVLTPAIPCSPEQERRLLAEAAAGRAGGTTVVGDAHGRALYFSKRVLPFRGGDAPALRLHPGLYAYTPDALARYVALPPGSLELAEGLEQLRFLEQGIAIRLVDVADRPGGLWEVNHPDDVPLVERLLGAAEADPAEAAW
ncbi:3-deoxy-manno-octulosonate cytidylyltransferase [Sphingomonas sp. CJ99]